MNGQNPQLDNVVGCDFFMMQENLPSNQHLAVQTGGNEANNKEMNCYVYFSHF